VFCAVKLDEWIKIKHFLKHSKKVAHSAQSGQYSKKYGGDNFKQRGGRVLGEVPPLWVGVEFVEVAVTLPRKFSNSVPWKWWILMSFSYSPLAKWQSFTAQIILLWYSKVQYMQCRHVDAQNEILWCLTLSNKLHHSTSTVFNLLQEVRGRSFDVEQGGRGEFG